jgi:osmotically-inducible protein OsmY
VVSSHAEKVAAGKAALRAAGTEAVANDLIVCHRRGPTGLADVSSPADTSTPPSDRGGAALARAVLAALNNSRFPLNGNVDVEVRDHAVYLSGTVAWDYQRVAASWEVERLPGVHVLHNGIRVRARCSASAVTSAIRDALSRSGCDRDHDVRADVDGGEVSLLGSVCSYTEWLNASHTAKSIPKVESVRNNLTISPRTSPPRS